MGAQAPMVPMLPTPLHCTQEKLLINNTQDFTTNMTTHILYGIVGQLSTLYQGKSPVQSIVILIVELYFGGSGYKVQH